MKVLNVAEKNDAAKNIANILSRGAMRKREGFSRFNKIYDFDYNIPYIGNCNMIMTSVSGHLINIDFTDRYRRWYSCDPVELFNAPIVEKCEENYVQIKRTLENECKRCSHLIIWTDCDREGECIGFEIINVCRKVNPSINIFRARFSEITPASITRAINNLDRPDKRLSDAVEVRRELDLRIGAAFTRYQTKFLSQRLFSAIQNLLISYGSCQFPTLGFVVERFKEIENFIPQKFWYISVKHNREKKDVNFRWHRVRNFDEKIVLALYTKTLQNPIAKVVDVSSKTRKKWRPTPMDTVQLEKLASKKLKINAKRTMAIAEKLYQQGYISYPRTETNIFPKEINLTYYVQQQVMSNTWGLFASQLLQQGLCPRNGSKTDNAHPPIHPTKPADNLSGDEARIYELITRHFLACLSKDAVGKETTVKIEINEEIFTADGLFIVERNYLEVYPYDKWSDKEIPRYDLGETFMPSEIMMNDGTTTPPQLLTEADLIALMEKHGIGTDATHAEHIETIKSRKYIGETPDRRFVPGRLGIGLIEGYTAMRQCEDLSKPHLRANLEKELQEICNGTKDPKEVLKNQLECYKKLFIDATNKCQVLENEVKKFTDGLQPDDISNLTNNRS